MRSAHVAFAASALLFVACGGLATAPQSGELTRSLAAWESAKGAGSSYDYSVPGGSWSGFGETTTLTVRSNKVVARAYSSTNYGPSGTPAPVPADSWSETGQDVGSHAAGAKPRLLEDLYKQCSDEVLTQDRGANDVFLTFDPQGILETCVYAPKGCQDDCSVGVQIRNLTIAK